MAHGAEAVGAEAAEEVSAREVEADVAAAAEVLARAAEVAELSAHAVAAELAWVVEASVPGGAVAGVVADGGIVGATAGISGRRGLVAICILVAMTPVTALVGTTVTVRDIVAIFARGKYALGQTGSRENRNGGGWRREHGGASPFFARQSTPVRQAVRAERHSFA